MAISSVRVTWPALTKYGTLGIFFKHQRYEDR